MRFNSRMASIGLAVVVGALQGCGGGGQDSAPPFEVTLRVNGAVVASSPLEDGESASVAVASGAEIEFAADEAFVIAPVAEDSTYEVVQDTDTLKKMSASSNGGGALVVVVADKDHPSRHTTVTFAIAPKEFAKVAMTDGQEFLTKFTGTTFGGWSWEERNRQLVYVDNATGWFTIDVLDEWARSYLYTVGYDPDGAHKVTLLNGGEVCRYDPAMPNQSYPMYVGKTWSGDVRNTCEYSPITSDTQFVRTVEAFETVTVPAGTFDTLRVRSLMQHQSVYGSSVTRLDIDRTCWWSVTLGIDVKCEATQSIPAGQDPTALKDHWARWEETLQSLGGPL